MTTGSEGLDQENASFCASDSHPMDSVMDVRAEDRKCLRGVKGVWSARYSSSISHSGTASSSISSSARLPPSHSQLSSFFSVSVFFSVSGDLLLLSYFCSLVFMSLWTLVWVAANEKDAAEDAKGLSSSLVTPQAGWPSCSSGKKSGRPSEAHAGSSSSSAGKKFILFRVPSPKEEDVDVFSSVAACRSSFGTTSTFIFFFMF
mmetsp:Transcript_2383/g.3536  ORF Transcript_2383/g.3536 Transcript_2383/m.3536 type:complete len:203 (+) Transcript_2383:1553-2161(+)